MSDDRAALITEEFERLKKLEEQKRLLYDKSVGGPMVLRPSDDFIRECVGDLKTDQQLMEAATERVDAQLEKEREKAQAKIEFEKSVREHNAQLDREREIQKLQELMQAMNERDRSNQLNR